MFCAMMSRIWMLLGLAAHVLLNHPDTIRKQLCRYMYMIHVHSWFQDGVDSGYCVDLNQLRGNLCLSTSPGTRTHPLAQRSQSWQESSRAQRRCCWPGLMRRRTRPRTPCMLFLEPLWRQGRNSMLKCSIYTYMPRTWTYCTWLPGHHTVFCITACTTAEACKPGMCNS